MLIRELCPEASGERPGGWSELMAENRWTGRCLAAKENVTVRTAPQVEVMLRDSGSSDGCLQELPKPLW